MATAKRVGLDSDALTFLVEAMSGEYDPATDSSTVAAERLAMYRVFLYADHPLYLTPTVKRQYEAITVDRRRLLHWEVHRFLICDALGNVAPDPGDERIAYLRSLHSGLDDCRIAAEAEQSGLTLLLSRDDRFFNNLNPVLNGLRIERPSVYWESLRVPRGSQPRIRPAPGNPLAAATWWGW